MMNKVEAKRPSLKIGRVSILYFVGEKIWAA
jgi:hypothetical protein